MGLLARRWDSSTSRRSEFLPALATVRSLVCACLNLPPRKSPLGFDVNDGDDADFGGGDDGGFTFGYDDEDPAAGPAQEDDNADYNLDDFDEVRTHLYTCMFR